MICVKSVTSERQKEGSQKILKKQTNRTELRKILSRKSKYWVHNNSFVFYILCLLLHICSGLHLLEQCVWCTQFDREDGLFGSWIQMCQPIVDWFYSCGSKIQHGLMVWWNKYAHFPGKPTKEEYQRRDQGKHSPLSTVPSLTSSNWAQTSDGPVSGAHIRRVTDWWGQHSHNSVISSASLFSRFDNQN